MAPTSARSLSVARQRPGGLVIGGGKTLVAGEGDVELLAQIFIGPARPHLGEDALDAAARLGGVADAAQDRGALLLFERGDELEGGSAGIGRAIDLVEVAARLHAGCVIERELIARAAGWRGRGVGRPLRADGDPGVAGVREGRFWSGCFGRRLLAAKILEQAAERAGFGCVARGIQT